MGLTSMNIERLQDIAKMAYGSGRFEGTKGGEGRIGMIDGKVVKFNTHIGERLFGKKATSEMFASCNELRKNLWGIAQDMGLDPKQLEKVRSELELDKSGNPPAKKLLDRTTVASVINILGKSREDHKLDNPFWDKLPDAKMKTADTSFTNVKTNAGERSKLVNSFKGVLSDFGNIVRGKWSEIAKMQGLDSGAKERFVVAATDRFQGMLLDGASKILDKLRKQVPYSVLQIQSDIKGLVKKGHRLLGGTLSNEDRESLAEEIGRVISEIIEAEKPGAKV